MLFQNMDVKMVQDVVDRIENYRKEGAAICQDVFNLPGIESPEMWNGKPLDPEAAECAVKVFGEQKEDLLKLARRMELVHEIAGLGYMVKAFPDSPCLDLYRELSDKARVELEEIDEKA